MRIKGTRGLSGVGFLICQVECKEPPFVAPIRLGIDTGASKTIIAERDAIKLKIDFDKLEREEQEIIAYGGTAIDARILKGVTITFTSEPPEHQESTDRIWALRLARDNKKERREVSKAPSVLGIDVLQRFRISFTPTEVFLDKDLTAKKITGQKT